MMAASGEAGRVRVCVNRVRVVHYHGVTLLLLLLCWSVPCVSGSAPPLVKVGPQDVHDEQSLQDRLQVLDILRQLQQNSLHQMFYKNKPAINSQKTASTTTTTNSGRIPHGDISATHPSHNTDTHPAHASVTDSTPQVSSPLLQPSELEGQVQTHTQSIDRGSHTTAATRHSEESHNDTGGHNGDHSPRRHHSIPTDVTATNYDAVDFSDTQRREHSSQTTNTDQKEPPTNTEDTDQRDPLIQNTDQTESTIQTEEDVDEVSLLFEGDIMLSTEEAQEVLQGTQNRKRKRRKRKVTYSKKKLWTPPIPYMFDQSAHYKLNISEIDRVKEAIAHLEGLTCITFREVNASDPIRPILSFKKDKGCWSYVGKEYAFRYQEVSTGEGCFGFGTLLHELGHAIGFWHEHSRPDREGFIRVHTERVRLGEEFNFKVESWGELDNKGVPYDVGSIMHYGSSYFSRSGREITVESLDARLQRVLGQRQEMSFYDVKLANLAYCEGACPNSSLQCQHEGYPDPKRCDRCRCPPGLSGITCNTVAPSLAMEPTMTG